MAKETTAINAVRIGPKDSAAWSVVRGLPYKPRVVLQYEQIDAYVLLRAFRPIFGPAALETSL
jgi:hypothetical protein